MATRASTMNVLSVKKGSNMRKSKMSLLVPGGVCSIQLDTRAQGDDLSVTDSART